MMNKFSIVIHGGAGALSDISNHRASIESILNDIGAKAEAGMSALDMVEEAVRQLENNPLFNAGKGAVLNAKGGVELDAAIMDGRNLAAGSIAGVHNIKNPVSLARKVMEKSPHVMLISEGAMEFAREMKEEEMPDTYFITEARVKQLEEAKKKGKIVLDHSDVEEKKLGTVGAVAIDFEGNIAAATSTGGIVNKQYGRIGDSAIVGAGVFAENSICGVSATGYGEQFIRTSLCKHIAEWIRYTKGDAQQGAQAGIDFLVEKVDGLGGVVVVDSNYTIGFAHSTPMILAGSIDSQKGIKLFF